MTQGDLFEETQKDGKADCLKAPIIQLGPQRMDCSTVRTTKTLEQHRFIKAIEKPTDVAMTPQPWTFTSGTPRRTWPRILLSHPLQELDIDIAIEYQVRSLGGITGDTTPAREYASVIPSLSLQLILRRKEIYTTNRESLGRVLDRTM